MSSSISLLENVPTDVLHIIFEQLPSTDLYALCLTRKNIRKCAEPFLYGDIRLIWMDEIKSQFRYARVPSLVSSILARPELASHVRNLELGGKTGSGYATQGRAHTIAYEPSQLAATIVFVDSIKHLIGPMADGWKHELQRGTMDAFVAVLLSQLTNLRRLDIRAGFGKETEFFGMLLRSALCNTVSGNRWLPTFEHLRQVTFGMESWDPARDYLLRNTADVLPLFYLPSLESLKAVIHNPFQFKWPAEHKPLASALTVLDLGYGRPIREDRLCHILSVTPTLMSLRWKFFFRPEDQQWGYGTNTMEIDTLMEALAYVRDTLTNLVLMAETGMERSDIEHPAVLIKGSLAPLADFPALTSLELPVAFVLGLATATAQPFGHLLPRNMEVFTLTDDLVETQENYEWIEDGIPRLSEVLQLWLKGCKAHTPRLRVFRLKSADTVVDDWDRTMHRQLGEVCQQVGVTFEVHRPQKRSLFR